VEGDEVNFVVVGSSHGGENLLERVEGFVDRIEDVGLVDFVGEEEDVVLVAETDDGSHVVFREAVSCWVSRVDHDELRKINRRISFESSSTIIYDSRIEEGREVYLQPSQESDPSSLVQWPSKRSSRRTTSSPPR